MIKILLLFGLLMGFYCDPKYKCIQYTGKLADMTDKYQCEGARCWRAEFLGTPKTVALFCLGMHQSTRYIGEDKKWVREGMTNSSVFTTAKDEELKITICAGDLCNKDANAVNNYTSACFEQTSLVEWNKYDYKKICYGLTCSRTVIGSKVLLGCADGCNDEYVNTMQKKAMEEYQKLTGFKAEKEDVKTTCCQENYCHQPKEIDFPLAYCFDYSEKLSDAREKYQNNSGKQCRSERCRYSVGGDRVLLECANEVECREQYQDQTRKTAFEKLSKNNPNLKAESDVKTSCCSSDYCNFVDKPAAESFAVKCYDYAGTTSEIKLDNTCLGESCVTINYGNRTELSCYAEMKCESGWIDSRKESLVGGDAKKYGEDLTKDDIEITCCSEDHCNNAAHLIPKKDESADANTDAPDATSSSLFTTPHFFLFTITLLLHSWIFH